MSHVARPARSAPLALLALLAACSSPKPPAGEAPAVGASASEPSPEQPLPEQPLPEPLEPVASQPVEPAPSPPEAPGSAGAASDAPVIETLFVRDEVADCQAEGRGQCLQVRSSEQEDWRNFFGTIEGFQYEPAHAYELRVAVSPVASAPADAPSLRYRLLEVVSKRKAPR